MQTAWKEREMEAGFWGVTFTYMHRVDAFIQGELRCI